MQQYISVRTSDVPITASDAVSAKWLFVHIDIKLLNEPFNQINSPKVLVL